MKHVEMYKWSDKCDKIYACKDMKDFNKILNNKINVDDHVVILPKIISEGKKENVVSFMLKSMEKTNTYPEYFHFDANNILDGFLSQSMKTMFVANDEYGDRKKICNILYEIYPNDKFIFHNQTLTNMAVDLYKCMFGYFPESVYNEETLSRLDEFSPKALQDCFIKFNDGDPYDENYESYDKNYVCFDYAKNYSSILINNKCDFPIYTIHNKIEKYDGKELRPGEYFVDKDIIIPFKTENGNPIIVSKGIFTKNAVEKLLNYNLITKDDIKYMLLCDRSLQADSFRNYIIFLFNTFEESIAKKMANQFIGYFGTKYDRTSTGYVTTSVESALASWSEAYTENANCTINTCNLKDIDLFLVRYISQNRKLNDYCSINRAIICDSNLLLIDMMYDVCNENSIIISYNTDSVFVRNPKKTYPPKIKSDIKYPIDQIGQIFVEDKEPYYFEKVHSKNEMNFDEKIIKPGNGSMIIGGAGCGKTTKLINDVLNCENPKIFCFTNNACKVIRNRLPDDKKDLVSTFDSYFNSFKGDESNLNKIKNYIIFIDEYSMVPNKWITLLYKAYKKYNVTINFYGDSNQCDPVDEISYNYLISPAMLEMCPYITKLNYIKESARYDEKTHSMLQYFLNNSKLNETFSEITSSSINLCYLNKTRRQINDLCSNWYMKKNNIQQFVEVKFNSKETYKVCNGMPVMCIDNIKQHDMMNSEQYTIQDINNDRVIIKENNIIFPITEFKEKFMLVFCVTVHKYQGGEINTHYNIFDVGLMDKKILYTALSRTKKFEYIHLINKELRPMYYIRKNANHKTIKPYQNEYKDAKIYKIEFDNGLIYIGCTTKSIEERLNEHLFDVKSVVYKNKQYNTSISLVCNYPCHSKEELESCETFYINKYAKLYKDKALNKRMNKEVKPKKVISFKCNIMNNEDFNNKILKKFVIKDNVKDSSLNIQFRDGDKRVSIKKRYNNCSKDEAMTYMKDKQQELIDKYMSDNK